MFNAQAQGFTQVATKRNALILNAGKQQAYALPELFHGVNNTDVAQVKQAVMALFATLDTCDCVINRADFSGKFYTFYISDNTLAGSPTIKGQMCSYILGLLSGALEVMTGKRVYGEEISCTSTGYYGQCSYRLELLG